MDGVRGSAGAMVGAGAAAFAVYVGVHPQGAVESARDVDEAVGSMAAEAGWVPSHILGMVALLLVAAGVWRLLRTGWMAEDRWARRSAWLLVVGALAAVVELVPHTLVASETAEIAGGASTPITDLHLLLQATLLPLYALGVAGLAVTGFGRVAHPLACAVGAIGGIALAAAGPVLLLTNDPDLGVLFMPGAGTFLFLFAAAVRTVRGARPEPAFAP